MASTIVESDENVYHNKVHREQRAKGQEHILKALNLDKIRLTMHNKALH